MLGAKMNITMLRRAVRLRIDAILEQVNEDDRLYEKGVADGYIAALVDFKGLSAIEGVSMTEDAKQAYLKQ
ncbi:hypothetical protein QN392_20425 [Pseudomonas sp. RTS4]|uniref:hypothetical protein n=2 Tax=Pseudomonas TaxID=286 RepID=UPI002B225449|nr:hypothetical protein [Pseudomonas sp. 5S4]MEA9979453.1 hypothetical protein [Pseudomonas sp. RTS4]